MIETAMLDVRALPWRPRARVMKPDTLREHATLAGPLDGDDLAGILFGLAAWIAVLVLAPLLVVVLAVALFSVELPLLLALAVLVVAARFLGLIPWTVLIVDRITGEEMVERYRSILRAVRRIRDVNHDRSVKVRWAWV
ncbi:hypothetical protein [Nocardioides sp. YIM 152588]|uniref:hypothetical protein n=1 Tax=Nocardioides sp. YIM 152588 TaxID=3158259 RepID=UPI0032E4FAB1